ncbi:hypothetical protein DRZ78_00065 [Candidatus Aerophobetes bacterium]|uniref:Tyr recombinase domain-containing protein n=1 Tax=Aerophobetes bacterium TaxID=2030807 RepID=A0A662D7B0_UNCAE|nr:MAG: hypothetical protein DRZ78_00065 [Candidatus Aerophobetes bacterium]
MYRIYILDAMETSVDTPDGASFENFMESFKEGKKLEKVTWEKCCELTNTQVLREFARWMRYEKGFTKKTIEGKIKKVRRFFRDTGKTLKEVDTEIRAAHKAYLLWMIEQGKLKRNYVATILTDLNVFFCNFLERKDLRIPSIQKETVTAERWTKEEIQKLISTIENSNIDKRKKALHRAIITALWSELPRVSELHDLTLGDIREMQRKVKLHSGKRAKVPANIRYPLATDDFLEAWKEYEKYRDSNDWSDSAPAFVQVNKKGKPVSVDFIRDMLKHYATEAGIDKPIYPHLIRKSAGTEIAMINPKLAQIQLGHKSIKTTLDHYTIPNNQDKEQINAILSLHPAQHRDTVLERLEKCTVAIEHVKESYLTQHLTHIGALNMEVLYGNR